MEFLKSIVMGCLALVLVLVNLFSAPALADTFEVKMGSDKGQLAFEPKVLTVKAGDTVRWINNKAYPHNVVFEDSTLSHPKLLLKPKQVVETTFTAAGEYSYYCTPHRGAGMVGKIIVQ
jgi:plastocyanin